MGELPPFHWLAFGEMTLNLNLTCSWIQPRILLPKYQMLYVTCWQCSRNLPSANTLKLEFQDLSRQLAELMGMLWPVHIDRLAAQMSLQTD